jgi:O-antigen/teichoic acid export membrane protein
LLILAVVNVVANLTLIPQFELAGAALATLMSVVLFNIFKTYFVYYKFKIHPFQRKIGYTFLISVFIVCLNMFLPDLANTWLSLIFKTSILGGVFVIGVLVFKLSEEANNIWDQLKEKLINK